MIIDSLKRYFKGCPLLKGGKINANYLGEKAVSYTIDNVPSNPIIKKYADGASVRQFLFVFASKEYYDTKTYDNFNVSGFYEEFAEWIGEKNDKKELPELDDGLNSLALEVLTSGYMFDNDLDKARYQIQLRLIYYKER